MRDYSALTEAEAEAIIDRIEAARPELVAGIIEATLMASPTAGPIRLLREIDAATGEAS